MDNKLGIDELSKLIKAVAGIGNVAGLVLEDGKISFDDMIPMGQLYFIFQDILGIDFGKIIPEAADLTTDEMDRLSKVLADTLDVPQNGIEVAVETFISFAINFCKFIKDVIDYVEILRKK